jgi:peptide/nickel transport system permease protein
MIHLLPGDPIDILLGGEGAAEDSNVRAVLMKQWGLDKPIVVQYAIWVWRALQGDFGKSFYSHERVLILILNRLPATLLLALCSMIVSVIVGLPAGIIAAVKRQKLADYASMTFSLLGISMPEFWLGIMLILLFSLWLRWLPAMGFESPFEDLIGFIKHLILPAVALGLRTAGVVTRMIRSSMLDEINQDYIRTARAKGLPERTVILVHTLKNALIPTVTILGLQFGYLLSGSLIVEMVFSWPGIGKLLVESILNRDYLVVQATTLVIACVFLLVNLFVDIIYTWLDPRIGLE